MIPKSGSSTNAARCGVYSPKVPEHFIPTLYQLGRSRGRPMTHLIAEAVERYLLEEGWLEQELHDAERPAA